MIITETIILFQGQDDVEYKFTIPHFFEEMIADDLEFADIKRVMAMSKGDSSYSSKAQGMLAWLQVIRDMKIFPHKQNHRTSSPSIHLNINQVCFRNCIKRDKGKEFMQFTNFTIFFLTFFLLYCSIGSNGGFVQAF